MMVREDTTKELMAAEITKWVDRLTQVRVKTTQKISGKKGYHDQKSIGQSADAIQTACAVLVDIRRY